MMKMETEIGNHGSKSIIGMPIHTFVIIVNEQRVDGSWWEKYKNTRPKIHKCTSHLRYTLMGFERNYQVSFLFNEIHTYRGYSTQQKVLLHPWFVTGFVDGEGSFMINIVKNDKMKIGWRVQPCFTLNLHKKDEIILEKIQKFFRVGSISKLGLHLIQFRVFTVKDLKVILDHFNKFPLKTQKCADFKLLKKVLKLIEGKEHLTLEGLHKILAIKASMNRGLSPELKLAKAPRGLCQILTKSPPPSIKGGRGGDFAKISLSRCSCSYSTNSHK